MQRTADPLRGLDPLPGVGFCAPRLINRYGFMPSWEDWGVAPASRCSGWMTGAVVRQG